MRNAGKVLRSGSGSMCQRVSPTTGGVIWRAGSPPAQTATPHCHATPLKGVAVAAVALAVLPLTLMFNDGGLKTVQTATLVVSLPLIFVGVLMAVSLVKQLRADFG